MPIMFQTSKSSFSTIRANSKHVRLFYQLSLVIWFYVYPTLSFGHGHEMQLGFVHGQVTDQLNNPTGLDIAPDGRIFISEKGGKIRIIENGELLATPMLSMEVDEHGERGLGSVLIDPDFEQNGFFYVYYSVYNGNFNRLSRFTASGNLVIPTSEKILMDFNKLAGTIHNSGAMRVGKDGKLYVTIGDGVSSSNGQNLETRLAKVIRLNLDGSIPEDNPFYNELEGLNRAIYAYGVRNSFTFDISPSTGQILANDVGATLWEEINEILPGKNYGWPLIEGYRTTEDTPDNYVDPIYAYPHENGDCAIVGAAFYEPKTANFPSFYYGKYLFCDYCTSELKVMDPTSGAMDGFIMKGAEFLSNMKVADDGTLYYLSFIAGELNKIVYVGDGSPFISKQPKSQLAVVGETVKFEIEAVGDSILLYQWYKDGDSLDDENEYKLVIKNASLAEDNSFYHCSVSNEKGQLFSDSAELTVTSNQRPIPVIKSPISGQGYKMGTDLVYAGEASDPEDGILPKSGLEWRIDFHHNVHVHPGLPATSGIYGGELPILSVGETDTNVWYRIHLKATDAQGLTNDTFVDIFPNISSCEVKSSPPGLPIAIDGSFKSSSFVLRGVEGNQRVLTAPQFRVRNDSLYELVGWSSGSENSNISILLGQEESYVAGYQYKREFVEGNGTGLQGTYYENVQFTEPFLFQRIDEKIDFYWDWFSPTENGRNDSIGIHWTGSVLAPITGVYTFEAEYDDAAKLSIRNETLICDLDNRDHGDIRRVSMYLQAGQKYPIDIQYREFMWSCKMKLSWAFDDQEMEIIPSRFLYPEHTDSFATETESVISIYPNPALDWAVVILDDFEEKVKQVNVFSVGGHFKEKQSCDQYQNRFWLDVGEYSPGVYIIEIVTTETKHTRKIIIK